MAAVTQDKATFIRSWEEGSKSGKLVQSVRQAAVVLSNQGGTTGDIPASLFGLAGIFEAYCYYSNNAGTPGGVDVILDGVLSPGDEGTGIVTVSWSTAALANATGTIFVTVKGRSL